MKKHTTDRVYQKPRPMACGQCGCSFLGWPRSLRCPDCLVIHAKAKARTPEARIKVSANRKVQNCIKRGLLLRQPCERCGSTPAQAHHDDYSRPLDVRWLCPSHHVNWHLFNSPKMPTNELTADANEGAAA
jgi:ribosomal protein S27AE